MTENKDEEFEGRTIHSIIYNEGNKIIWEEEFEKVLKSQGWVKRGFCEAQYLYGDNGGRFLETKCGKELSISSQYCSGCGGTIKEKASE